MNKKLRSALDDVIREFKSASSSHDKFNSAHEGFAILYEEVDELWDWVKKKEKNRSKKEMRGEAKQIAAMALRFMVDLT